MRYPATGFLTVTIGDDGLGRAVVPFPFDRVVSVTAKANDSEGAPLPKAELGIIANPFDAGSTVVCAEGDPGSIGVVVGVV